MYGAFVHGCAAFGGQSRVTSAVDLGRVLAANGSRSGEPGRVRIKNSLIGLDCLVCAVGPGYVIQHVDGKGRPGVPHFLPPLAFHLFSVVNERIKDPQTFTVAQRA